jgi:uncharacterized protein YdeI (YjbR/CyaY-like superfamily)
MPVAGKPTFFATPAAFRRWLERHHDSAPELWVGFHKKATGRPSITWQESVDEALCFGWIDGIRKSLDADSYVIRFTPRRPGSNWSNVNIARVKALTSERRMQPTGLAAFTARDPKKSGIYAYEVAQAADPAFDPALEAQFKKAAKAWAFFSAQPPGYRKLAVRFVMTAIRDETRARRLKTLIDDSAAGRRIGLLRRPEPGSK